MGIKKYTVDLMQPFKYTVDLMQPFKYLYYPKLKTNQRLDPGTGDITHLRRSVFSPWT